jgi:hypothetical protein
MLRKFATFKKIRPKEIHSATIKQRFHKIEPFLHHMKGLFLQ